MATPDHQPATDLKGTIVPLLEQIRTMLGDIGFVALRIEGKLDDLLDALAEEEEGESEQTTLDGDVVGAERDEGQPL